MRSMQMTGRVNNNGLLQIKLPPEFSGQEIEVVLVIQPHQKTVVSQLKWQEFIKRTYGSFADEPLTRPDELLMETREELI